MSAHRIIIPDTAFSIGRSSVKKRPRDKNDKHLAFVRKLPCAVCGTHASVEAAHVRMASPVHGKRETGFGEKSDDRWALPLCMKHHNEQHDQGEREFWNRRGIDACNLALAIWSCTGDDDIAGAVIKLQRENGKKIAAT